MRSRQAKKNLGKNFDTLTSEVKEKTIRTLLSDYRDGRLTKKERLLFEELVKDFNDEDLIGYVIALRVDASLMNRWRE